MVQAQLQLHRLYKPNAEAVRKLLALAEGIDRIDIVSATEFKAWEQHEKGWAPCLASFSHEDGKFLGECECAVFAKGVEKAPSGGAYPCPHLLRVLQESGFSLDDLPSPQGDSNSEGAEKTSLFSQAHEASSPAAIEVLPTLDAPLSQAPAGISSERIEELAGQIALFERFVEKVLKPEQDFGIIPGTSKPTLLKPGAASIIAAFNCYSRPTVLQHDLDHETGYESFLVQVEIVHHQAGQVRAVGLGMCNSFERKYRYKRTITCPSCGKDTVIKGREEYGGGWVCFKKRGGCGAHFKDTEIEAKAENPDLQDLSNTLLKMATKRAEVDAALKLPGVARFFTQDVEEIMREPERKGG